LHTCAKAAKVPRMKNALIAAALVVLVTLSPTCVESAFAGEIYLGTIAVTDAGIVNNGTTATTFYINPSAILTIQCDTAADVITDQPAVDAGTGVYLGANYLFATSINGPKNLTLRDAGIQSNAGIVAVAPNGSAATSCKVFSVRGNE